MELQTIQNKIYEIRGQRVMLDRDLAELYGVETKALNKAVKRNSERFPERFMFQLTKEESLRFQIGTLNERSGKQARGQHLKYLPHVFTEQGVSMLSAVLRSPTAIQVSIRIMDAFVAMRNYIMTTSTITAELSEIRAKLTLLERADEDNAEAVNDLSEDMRKELDNIYEAIAALSVKVPQARRPPHRIQTPRRGRIIIHSRHKPMKELTTIQSKIHEIRGQQVMLDFDLAALYQVETKVLKQAVRRNIERFPEDFIFEISNEEYNSLKISLRSQIVTLEIDGRGKYPKYPPFAFTEMGVAMLSSVLRSGSAIQVNIAIMRAFVAMRNYLTQASQHSAELAEMRSRLQLIEHEVRENLKAMNDMSEDIGKDIDAIYEAIGALSVKLPQIRQEPQKIGFKK